jgi:hypothetical protein
MLQLFASVVAILLNCLQVGDMIPGGREVQAISCAVLDKVAGGLDREQGVA